MKITTDWDTLRVTDLRDLNDLRTDELAEDLRRALRPVHSVIEFDLTQLHSIDCGAVEALLAVYEELNLAGTSLTWRVLNPPPDVRQLFELVRLHHLFEITPPRPPRMILL